MKLVLLLVTGGVLFGTTGAHAAPDPARLQVVAHEFTLALSRPSVPAGPVVIQLVNMGMDPHDVRLQRIGGKRVYGTKTTLPGARSELDVTLLAGRYRVWCSIADHRERGMRTTLRVVPRKSS